MSGMADQVRQAKEEAKTTAKTGEGGNPNGQNDELPQGTSPVETREDSAEVAEEVTEESEAQAASAEGEAGDDLIRIGDKEFKTQAEAIKYAQQLEEENLRSNLYNQGVRDALASGQQAQAPQAEPEDNFEERFYSDPKGTLRDVQAKATQDAIAVMKAEVAREKQWDVFLNKYPDVRRKDAERVLGENWETIGKMTDVDKAMGVLANKVRSDYEEIVNLAKPRTELANKRGQVVSPSGGAARGVTQSKKDDKPLDFVSQMRTLKK
jgi:hypothetical protein